MCKVSFTRVLGGSTIPNLVCSGWFDYTEPSLTTFLQGKQGVQGDVH